MTRINTNVSSLTAQKTLARSNEQLQESLTRLSTGLRINKGKDDPAGLIASEVLRSDIVSIQRAITNSQRANQLIATADSALNQVSSLLNDIRGLISEAANTGALSPEQIAANQLQVDSSLEAIDRIAQTTTFQGRRLLDGSLDFLHTATAASTTARGTFGSSIDARASGQIGTTQDVRATGAFGTVLTDSRAVATFGAITTDARAQGTFGTETDVKSSVTLSAGAGAAVIRFTAQEVGTPGNSFSVNIAIGGTSALAVAFDGAAKSLTITGTATHTAADIVSAVQANASAYAVFSASVVTAGVISAATSGLTAGGTYNNNIILSATNFGSLFNTAAININHVGLATGAETAAYDTGARTLNIYLNTATSATANVLDAINAQGAFNATTTGAGLGRYGTTGAVATNTAGGEANNQVLLTAVNFGAEFKPATISLQHVAALATGSETAAYDTATRALTVFYNTATSKTSNIVSAINAQGTFHASTTGAGEGIYTTTGAQTHNATGGSANNQILISAAQFGAQFNSLSVIIADGAATGAETAAYNTATNVLTVYATTKSTTSQVVSAINSTGAFRASTSGAGLGTYSFGGFASVTTGGSASNQILLSATSIGAQFNDLDVVFQTGAATGNETAVYNTASNALTVTIDNNSTAQQVVEAINNATSLFAATIASGASGLGTFSAGPFNNVTQGGSNSNQIILSARSSGTQFNNLDLTVVIATGAETGAETAVYNTAANTLTMSVNAASTAQQVVQAINQTSVFAAALVSGASGLGTYSAGTTTDVTRGAGQDNVSDLQIDQANFGTADSIGINVQIRSQATQASLQYSSGALTADTILEVAGLNGVEVFNFGNGTTVSQLAEAINLVSDATGVVAEIDAVTGALTFESIAYGSKAFVGVKALQGVFQVTSGGIGAERVNGTDVDLTINGLQANGDGLRASLNSASLDIAFTVNEVLTDGSAFEFEITGGGAIFQIGPDVVSNQQARIGIQGVRTATLGGVSGKLFEIRSGNTKSLDTDTVGAAKVVDEVITLVTSLRGRLGAFQRTTLETNIFTLTDTIENLSEAESSIRDADFAIETARLTRAQILVRSGTSVLQIANQNPQNVLALLQ